MSAKSIGEPPLSPLTRRKDLLQDTPSKVQQLVNGELDKRPPPDTQPPSLQGRNASPLPRASSPLLPKLELVNGGLDKRPAPDAELPKSQDSSGSPQLPPDHT